MTADHPAAILDREADRLSDPAVHTGTITYPLEYRAAANLLRGYEVTSGVTFAALDNDTLAAVREAYARGQNTGGLAGIIDAQADLASAVADLLGLDDDLPEPVDAPPAGTP